MTELRRYLLIILLLSLVFTGGELLLVEHTEDLWQWIPLLLIALGLAVIAWHGSAGGTASVRALRIVMVLHLAGGVLGTAMHWNAKMEFKSEMNPSLRGPALWWESLGSVSPPALAPGAMIQMGLLGLLYAHKHPRLSGAARSAEEEN